MATYRNGKKPIKNNSAVKRTGRQGSEISAKVIGDEKDREAVFGIHPVHAALEAGRREKLYSLHVRESLYKEAHDSMHRSAAKLSILHSIIESARRQQLQVFPAIKRQLDKISCGGLHQGVCLMADQLNYESFSINKRMLNSEMSRGRQLWLMLDDVTDPMNLGAIIRTSSYFGVDRILCTQSCSSLTAVVSKASAGALEFTPLYKVDSMIAFVEALRGEGWQVVATVCDSSTQDISDVAHKLNTHTAVLIGGEGDGLSDELMKACTEQVNIKSSRSQTSHNSLNVSVATGILLHELSK